MDKCSYPGTMEFRVFKTPREPETCSRNREFEIGGRISQWWKREGRREMGISQYIN